MFYQCVTCVASKSADYVPKCLRLVLGSRVTQRRFIEPHYFSMLSVDSYHIYLL